MTVAIHIGDCRDVLRTLPDESVHCVVTSPPYWGLRDYGTARWEGGDAACDHRESKPSRRAAATAASTLDGGKGSIHLSHQFNGNCGHCGAIRIDSQIGLEPDFRAYVANMVDVFREVRRVLRRDGTLWLNLGDSYAAGGGFFANAPSNLNGSKQSTNRGSKHQARTPPLGLKPKDLCGIPWRVAFALQADGWYLRQDIIWSKPNPMPESVTDRCTKSHEYLFLLSKSERYYYDTDAIREPHTGPPVEHFGTIKNGEKRDLPDGVRGSICQSGKPREYNSLGRNKRSVWEVSTQPFSEAHFATFPPALIEPCIKAGCPKDGTVLDPFAGAGTTGLVADRLQRSAILIELNPDYSAMSERRIVADAPLFAHVARETWAEMWAKPFDFSQEPGP